MLFLKGHSFFKLVGCFYGVAILKVMPSGYFWLCHGDQGVPLVLQMARIL